MKTKLLLVKALLFTGLYSVNGQVIPNFNFEYWSAGTNSAPDAWRNHGSNHPGFYPVTQSTDSYLGSYSVRLENKVTSTDTTKGSLETLSGNPLNEGMIPTFPVSVRHTTLKGFYKFSPQNGDSAVIVAASFKTGYAHSQGFGNLLSFGWKTIGATTVVWTPFSTMNFYYDSPTVIPDSAYISLASFQEMNFATGARYPVKGNSVLYVDALNYDSWLNGVSELNITSNFKLYPTVSNGNFEVCFETRGSGFTSIKIYSMEGKEMMNLYAGELKAGTHSYKFDTGMLSNGSYLFVIASEKGYTSERIIINK